MIKEDCFSYVEKNKHQGCKALKELYCKQEKCKFYKSKEEINIEKIEEDIKSYSKI